MPDRHLRAAADGGPGDCRGASGWDGAVEAWRARYRVPDEVNLARWDRAFRVDLTDPWHREVFRDEVRQGGSLAIMEDLTDGGRALGWADGHSGEVVIPMARVSAPAPALRPVGGGSAPKSDRRQATEPGQPSVSARRPTDHGVRHLPGEEWLYAKFYAVEDTHDEFLHAHLPTLLRAAGDEVRDWHFLRYRDPDPHVRLRLHGAAEVLRTTVLPRLAAACRDWQEAGVIRGVVLDTYQPETDRYGGPVALPHAERMFCVDSRSALAQLTLRARGRLALPDPVLAAVNHALLLESLGDWDWSAWISRVLPKSPAHAVYRRHQKQARSLIVPGRTAESAAPALGAPLSDLWTHTPETRVYGALVLSGESGDPGTGEHAEAVLSLLHMQHNRLLGIDRAGENAGYAVLRGIARDHQGRLAHTRQEERTR
ncbi:thiopeptide-type bacteriocin biosynthesis protein [Streptomyces sp. MA5143a]|uniref:thiopeptide-type bacteriocin biosynthesis protein n=1 Tax=Streptomyces sp. MA5143a TaxID=2083010 RepID=UPI000D294E7F|nr:thiopeptide-type bacteriocin biosynthesis protein [Streptomyces sp. MA5143a]SPF00430.1 thiopeptide-type bacteriocin biosynthesis domain protein [Streptomyces sp. MA5143a]